MDLILKTAPASAVLSTAEARARCNISSSVDDATVDALVSAATATLDGYSGWLSRALITQTWQMVLPGFDDHRRFHRTIDRPLYVEALHHPVESQGIRIPLPPLQSISSIKYYDSDGTQQTLDPANYRTLQGTFAHVFPLYGQTWPATRVQTDAVTIEFVCGYGPAGSNIPEPVRQAIALQVSYLSAISQHNMFLTHDKVEGLGEKRYQVVPGMGNIASDAVRSLISNYRVTL